MQFVKRKLIIYRTMSTRIRIVAGLFLILWVAPALTPVVIGKPVRQCAVCKDGMCLMKSVSGEGHQLCHREIEKKASLHARTCSHETADGIFVFNAVLPNFEWSTDWLWDWYDRMDVLRPSWIQNDKDTPPPRALLA